MFLVLAFPTGRLTGRHDRVLVAFAALVVGLLYLPTAALVEQYPSQTPWSSCGADCPANAFMLVDRQPAFIDAWLVPARELITFAIFLVVVGLLALRVRRATYLQRRVLSPVLFTSAVLMSCLAAFVAARRTAPGAPVVETLGWIYAACIPGVAIGFLIGMARWQLHAASVLERLTVVMRRRMGPEELRDTLASALGDPSLQLAYRRDRGWVDATGAPLPDPAPGPGRALTELRDESQLLTVLIHDAALRDDDELLAAVGACALTAVEHQRRLVDVDAGLHELEASRARLVTDADDERRRIERDLHDGAQQRLVALRIRLELAGEASSGSGARERSVLRGFGVEVEAIIDEIRSLAHGVYPSLLADSGLPDALRSAARRTPVPARVDADGIGRYAQEIEAAVYFTCLEALQNVIKHAPAASGVWISLRDTGALRFEVRDDGPGFAEGTITQGAGTTNMRDRIAAVGGTLTVRSAPGDGTRVIGTVPV